MEPRKVQAAKVLSALSASRRLRVAYVFDNKNEPFAQYLDPDSTTFVEMSIKQDFHEGFPADWEVAEEPVVYYGLRYLSLYAPIYTQDTKIGSLYLLSDVSDLNRRLAELLLVVLLSGGAAVGFAWGLSGWLQKPISGPILQLVDTMHKISLTGDYKLRSEKHSDDEIGQLVDGFNDMLTQVQVRDQKIDAHQKYLEQTVNERTAELTVTIKDLERAREQADSANQAKSVFLANITHELRTPLVGVLGMNELLAESSLDTQQQALASAVQRSGQSLLELINDILDFSRIEGGHLSLKTEKVDLLKLVEETLVMLADRAYSKGLELVCYIAPAAAWKVEADPQRLSQILVNLIGNAIKFTHKGHVSIRLTCAGNGSFLFEVSDSGIGIDKESQLTIFQAFSQVDSSTARIFGGTGLGLSIVSELTTMMGGHLNLESELDRGSSFRVELPLTRIKPSFVRLPEDRLGQSAIILEAYPPARAARLQMLLDLGFAAEAVASQEDLSQKFKKNDDQPNSYDLVVLSGFDLEEVNMELVAQSGTCGRRVICLSKKLPCSTGIDGVVEILQPLLWSHLLRGDLVAEPGRNLSLVAKGEGSDSPAASNPTSKSKGRILVVDDNVSTRELIGFSLAGSDWQSDEVCSAEDALIAVQNQPYLLILMDVNMPGTDGLEATRILRKLGIDTPVFALTAHGDEKIFEECLQAGMQGFLRKPFRQKELFSLLEEQTQLACNKESFSEEQSG